MQQQTIALPLGKAMLVISHEEAARILIEQLSKQPAVALASHLPKIGEFVANQGGVYAGMMRGYDGHPDYHLIVATGDAGFVREIAWGGYGQDSATATSDWDGHSNTMALARETGHPAAEWAAGLNINGHADWYLPAKREAALCFANAFELFKKCWYWTSTQSSPGYAWTQHFADGGQSTHGKHGYLRARAVRRFTTWPL